MQKTVFNLEALVCVEIRDKRQCGYLKYRPFKKSFWGNTEEGFYSGMSSFPYTKEEIEQGKFLDTPLLVIEKAIYYHPYVRLTFAGGKGKCREFSTYEEALQWGTAMANKGINVKLETDGKNYTTTP